MAQPRLIFASRLHRSEPATSSVHAHPDAWQMEYCLTGPITCHVGEEVHELTAGSLIAMPPGAGHRQESGQGADSYMLRFVHPWPSRPSPGVVALALLPGERETAERLLADLVAEYDGRGRERERMIGALLEQLVLWIDRWRLRGAGADSRGHGHLARERVRAVGDLLRRRYAERLTVAELAEAALLSRSRFMEIFREEFGAPPIEFHRRVQMEKAVDLARHTGLPWRQIASHLGYEDPAYFSRLFKRVMAVAPSRYAEARPIS